MSEDLGLFEAIYTLRAMRRLKPDPVPEEALWKVLEAATRAPSGANVQPWNFVVIRDAATKAKIAEYYRDAWDNTYGRQREAMLANPAQSRTYRSAEYLAHHLAEMPVLILICSRGPIGNGGSIFPAVQNLMLAARGLGLGTSLTSLHRLHEAEIKALLDIPAEVETAALIPLGYPRGKFGAGPRRPVEQVAYWDKWSATKERP